MDIREEIIIQVRERISRKSSLIGLDDGALYKVFSMFRSQSSNEEVAKWLHEQGLLTHITVLSLPKIIGKLRKSLAPLLIQAGKLERRRSRTGDIAMRDLQSLDSLERLEEIERVYSEIIARELQESIDGAPLPATLARHVQALAVLQKSRQKLVEVEEKKPKPEPTLSDNERDQFNTLVGRLNKDSFAAQTRKFMELVRENSIEMETDSDGNPIVIQ